MSRSRIAQAFLATAIIVLLFAPFLVRASVRNRYESQIYGSAEAPNRNAALVFGAAVNRGGWLSTVLRDRMDTAISLYKNGVVERIVVSGHQDGNGYDEPGSMKAYAIAAGVSESDIVADTKGDRTYDTCFRALNEFQLESALLVTQEFHLPRALLTCNTLGMEVDGVRADMRNYRGSSWYEFRETVATLVALADLIRKDDPDQADIVESHDPGEILPITFKP